MLTIALATLRTRTGGFVGALVALFCAGALVSGCGMLLDTGLRGHVAPQRYAAAPLLVAADQQLHFVKHKHGKTKIKSKPATETVHLPGQYAARIHAVPGVAAAVPEVTFPATVLDRPRVGDSWGHSWRSAALTPFTLAEGRAPAAPDEVVVDAATRARVGDRLTVQTPQSAASYSVVGVTAQALPGQRSVFFADATANRLAGDRLTAVGVWPAAGTDRRALAQALSRMARGVRAYTGNDKGTVEFRGAVRAKAGLISMSAVITATALLVAILVVVGTFALSIEQRRREIALLRAVGATPRQLRRMLAREALVLGLIGAGLGGLASRPLAGWLHDRFVAFGTIPRQLPLVTNPVPVIIGVLAVVVAALLASRIAARSALRTPAAAALTGTDSVVRSCGSRIAGVLLLGAGSCAMVLLRALHTEPAAMPVTMLATVAAAAGVMLLGPTVGRLAGAAAGIPLRLLSRTAGYLAAENVRADPRRMGAVIGPLTLAVSMAAAVVFVGTTLDGAARRQVRDGTVAGYALRSSGAGVPADVVRALRATRGVTAVTPVLHSTVWIGKNRYSAQGVTPARLTATMDLAVTDGSIDGLAGAGVALSTTAASGAGVHVGDSLALRLGDGTSVRLRVVATYARGLGFGALTLPYDLLARHVDVPMPSTVLVTAPTSAGPALHAFVAAHPGTQLINRAALAAVGAAAGDAAVRLVALGLIVAFSAISVVNTLAIATLDRRREFALLRRLGATRRQLLRMLRAETLAVVASAVLLGAAIGAGVLAGFASGMTGTAAPTVPLPGCLVVVAVATVLAYLGTAVPARIMLRAGDRPA